MPVVLFAAMLSHFTTAERLYSTWMSDTFLYKDITPTYGYTESVLYRAIDKSFRATKNPIYLEWLQSQIDEVVSPSGDIRGYPRGSIQSLDDYLFGTNILNIYARTKSPRYTTAVHTLRRNLDAHPRTPDGGFWHRAPTYPDQMWLDGIFMVDVFYAQYTATFEPHNNTAWDDITLQFRLVEQHTRNASTGLLYHGFDASGRAVWADEETGASPYVWSRAVGWYMMALADCLDYWPKQHVGRRALLGYFRELAEGVVKAQDEESGNWYLLLDPELEGREGNYIESSGTAMFVYGLLKGVRMGYLGKEYSKSAAKGYEMMVEKFVRKNRRGGLDWEGTVRVGSLSGNASYEVCVATLPFSSTFRAQTLLTVNCSTIPLSQLYRMISRA